MGEGRRFSDKVIDTWPAKVVIGMAIAVGSAVVMGAWNSKESVSNHSLDVQAVRSERKTAIDSIRSDVRAGRVADSAWHAQNDRTMKKVLCKLDKSEC